MTAQAATEPRIDEAGGLRAALAAELRGRPGAALWPKANRDIPDDELVFTIAYLGPEWGALGERELHERLDPMHRLWGHTRRQFRNALAFAVPGGGDSPETFYRALMLPREGQSHVGATLFDEIELPPSRPGEGLHERALRALAPSLHEEIEPAELARIIGLGETDCAGVRRLLFPMPDAARWFFCFLNLPRLRDASPVRRAVARGVASGEFGLLRGRTLLPLDGWEESWARETLFRSEIPAGEIAFESGDYLVWRQALES